MNLHQRLIMIAVVATLTACSFSPSKDVRVDGIDISESKANSTAAVYAELGLRYMQKGSYKLSIQKLRKAIELDPELPSAYLYLAQLYSPLDQLSDAETYFKKSIGMDPDYSRAQNNYGAFLCGHKRYAESEQQFLGALANPLYENSAATLENLGLCSLDAGQTAKAEGFFKQALDKNPLMPTSLYTLAQINYDRGDLKTAQLDLDRYRRVAQQTPSSLWLGIQVARKLGHKDTAASLALMLNNAFPKSPQAVKLKGSSGKIKGSAS